MAKSLEKKPAKKNVVMVEEATVRFAGDSGDGMQLAGTLMSNVSALAGNDVATFPDYPSEIRAPRGTLAGVSGFQVHFAAKDIYTPGEEVDTLVAMNPAALKTNLPDLKPKGTLIVDSDEFNERNLEKAGYASNPLENGSLDGYRLIAVPLTSLTHTAVEETGLGAKEADRCRNFFAVGLVSWLYDRSLEPTLRFIEERFGKKPEVAEANRRTLLAGHNYGDTIQAAVSTFKVSKAELPPGRYRSITGNEATAWGLMAAAHLSGKDLFLGSYPITPASDILHELSKYKEFGVRTFQAEDEIAAICAVIGASYAGALGVTTSSGPGVALKSEALGLAVMLELPLILVSVQRGGPSTGLPTKTEQSDLLQVMFGRHGEAPIPILAASRPADCFDCVIEAWRIAVRFMTPVILLSDGYIGNGAEPWCIPDINKLPKIEVKHPGPREENGQFLPYERDEMLSRPWALPGTRGLAHRIGGLEKDDRTGNVSHVPENHHRMVMLRAQKIANVAKVIPPQTVVGPERGKVLILSWGGTYGSCFTAVEQLLAEGKSVAHAHLRYLFPMPANLGEILSRYEKILIPEINAGQLRMLIRANYLIEPIGLNRIYGKPLPAAEVVHKVNELLADK